MSEEIGKAGGIMKIKRPMCSVDVSTKHFVEFEVDGFEVPKDILLEEFWLRYSLFVDLLKHVLESSNEPFNIMYPDVDGNTFEYTFLITWLCTYVLKYINRKDICTNSVQLSLDSPNNEYTKQCIVYGWYRERL